jgi:hypothetical protein
MPSINHACILCMVCAAPGPKMKSPHSCSCHKCRNGKTVHVVNGPSRLYLKSITHYIHRQSSWPTLQVLELIASGNTHQVRHWCSTGTSWRPVGSSLGKSTSQSWRHLAARERPRNWKASSRGGGVGGASNTTWMLSTHHRFWLALTLLLAAVGEAQPKSLQSA